MRLDQAGICLGQEKGRFEGRFVCLCAQRIEPIHGDGRNLHIMYHVYVFAQLRNVLYDPTPRNN